MSSKPPPPSELKIEAELDTEEQFDEFKSHMKMNEGRVVSIKGDKYILHKDAKGIHVSSMNDEDALSLKGRRAKIQQTIKNLSDPSWIKQELQQLVTEQQAIEKKLHEKELAFKQKQPEKKI